MAFEFEVGQWPARAVEAALGRASTGTEQVAVRFQFLDGPNAGHYLTWYGFFSDAAADRTIESLRHTGWQGDDLNDLSSVGSQDCEVVVAEDDFNGESRVRIAFVNGASSIALADRMSEDEAKSFADRMRGRVLALGQKGGKRPAPAATRATKPANAQRQAAPPPHTDDDIPF